MGNNSIGDFLLSIGFDSKQVETGLRKISKLLNQYEKDVTKFAKKIDSAMAVATSPKTSPATKKYYDNLRKLNERNAKEEEKQEARDAKKELLRIAAIRKALNNSTSAKMKLEDRYNLAKKLAAKADAANVNTEFNQFRQIHNKKLALLKQQARQQQLNSRAPSRIRNIASSAATGAAVGVAAAGVGVNLGLQAQNAVKEQGQQLENIIVQYNNLFGKEAADVAGWAAEITDAAGQPILDGLKSFSEFYSVTKGLGGTIRESQDQFERMNDAMNSFGMSRDAQQGFSLQLTQALASSTRDAYLEAFRQWSPALKADLEAWLKSVGTSIDSVLERKQLSNYWARYLQANAARFEQMSLGLKQSSSANEQRAKNQITYGQLGIFATTGFQTSLISVNNILENFGKLLQDNRERIGKIFGVFGQALNSLANKMFAWLLTFDEVKIENFIKNISTQGERLIDVLDRLITFLDKILPSKSDSYVPVSKEVADQNQRLSDSQTQNWRGNSYAPGLQLLNLQQSATPKVIPQVNNSPSTININTTVHGGAGINEELLSSKILSKVQLQLSGMQR